MPSSARPSVGQTRGVTAPALEELLALITDSGLIDEPVVNDGLVRGRAPLDAARTVVTVEIDPELEDREPGDLDKDALLEILAGILSVSERRWQAVIDEVVAELEDAVADVQVIEQTDLRDDLEASSVLVFTDAVLVAFDAPRQFPESRILVQLDDELAVVEIEVVTREEADASGPSGEDSA